MFKRIWKQRKHRIEGYSYARRKKISASGVDEHEDKVNITSSAQPHLPNMTLDRGSLAQTPEPVVRPLTIWQRARDIVIALFGLVVLSPVLILVALMIKSVSRGPVLFKQYRVGYKGKTFTMWKFRTLKISTDATEHISIGANNENSNDPMAKLDYEPRIIPFGKILRKTCLDEVPQLFNVLRGEMSLVGPRPAIDYEVQVYSPWHYRRLDAVPGMTGLWQVGGKYALTFNEMVRLDIEYLRQKSFWYDMVILLKTPLVVISQIMDSFAFRANRRPRLKPQNLRKLLPPLSLLAPKAERWAISLSFWIPRRHREGIQGDLLEDCLQLRQFGFSELRIRIHVIWQLAICVVTLLPDAIISKVVSSVIRNLGLPKDRQ